MGYELEHSAPEFTVAPSDVRWLEHRLSNANRQLQEARASSVELHRMLKPDHPVLLANEIRLAHAKLRWAEAIEALCDFSVDED